MASVTSQHLQVFDTHAYLQQLLPEMTDQHPPYCTSTASLNHSHWGLLLGSHASYATYILQGGSKGAAFYTCMHPRLRFGGDTPSLWRPRSCRSAAVAAVHTMVLLLAKYLEMQPKLSSLSNGRGSHFRNPARQTQQWCELVVASCHTHKVCGPQTSAKTTLHTTHHATHMHEAMTCEHPSQQS
jgi:hypothetical protein